MNLSEKWKITYQSICLVEHYKNGKIVGSGTGFKIKDRIITNNHVYYNQGTDKTTLTFVEADCTTIRLKKTYSQLQFQNLLITGDSKDNWDYAILDATDADFNTIPPLQLAKSHTIEIGTAIYFSGFPLLKNNLTISNGTIASKFTRSGVKYIQINANVNNGNSGGPLFDKETDLVIGIVTRKNTGLSERFDNLKLSFKSNVEQIKQSRQGVKVNFGGLDPVAALEVTQNQFMSLCDEIVRSSNVGIGYAFELDELNYALEE